LAVNVLFLHNGENWIRGSENALLSLLRGLGRSKIAPFVLSSNTALTELAQAEGIDATAHPIPYLMVDGDFSSLRFGQWAATLRKIFSLIRSRKVQLLYCNGASPCQIAYYAGKLLRIPVVCHIHSPYDRRYIRLFRFHRASKTIFVSKAIEESARKKQHFSAPTEVVYCGVDTEGRFRPVSERNPRHKQELSLPADAFVFGQVSSLIPRKGIDVLLRAFQLVSRRHSKARLVLVGDGPNGKDYLDLANELGLGAKVVFAGHRGDPGGFYQHVFDVNVLASRSEALPLCLLESAACGLPSVAANVGGIAEAVLDDQTGLLFDTENHLMLADKMSQLITAPAARRKLGEAARQLALERFSMGNYLRSIERIILEQVVLGESGIVRDALTVTHEGAR